MAIKAAVFILFVLSIFSYFTPVENLSKKSADMDTPVLTFKESTMYTLTSDSMNRIIYSDEVLRYKDRDVMHKGALTLKGKDKDNKEVTDILYADIIIKRDEELKFINEVKYKRDDSITLNTDELIYNVNTKVATNTMPFNGSYFDNYIKGENIYLDLNKYNMKASNTHLEIEVEKR